MSGCCAPPCRQRARSPENCPICCSSVPRFLCVSLFTDDYYEPESRVQAAWDCQNTQYTASFQLNDGSRIGITLSIFAIDDHDIAFDGKCWLILSSFDLGYVIDEYGYDNRIWIPLGGPYQTAEVRRANCDAFVFDVGIEIPLPSYYSSSSARLHFEPAEYISRNQIILGRDCMYDRVCITRNDGVNSQTVYACFDDYLNGWEADFGEVGKYRVLLPYGYDQGNGYATVLSHNGVSKEAECPAMSASWTFNEVGYNYGYDQVTLSIKGDSRADCSDCRCWCRDLCISYFRTDSSVGGTVKSTFDEYGGWAATFSPGEYGYYEPTVDIRLNLVCDECDRTTYLELVSPVDGALLRKEIVCPDNLTAEWTILIGGGNYIQVTAACAACGDCSLSENVIGSCCENSLPRTLFATFAPGPEWQYPTDAGSCLSVEGQVIELVFDDQQQLWIGSGFPFRGCPTRRVIVVFGCATSNSGIPPSFTETPGDGEAVWGIFIGNFAEGVSQWLRLKVAACDPLMVEFGNFTNVGGPLLDSDECCQNNTSDTGTNNFDVLITQ